MKFQRPYTIRLYECTSNGKLDFSFLLNYFMDAAAAHTIDLNITVPELLKRGFTWMLSRYHIIIDHYPVYADTVNINTWVADHKGFFSIREYSAHGMNDEIIAKMTSSWVLYDVKEKKIVNMAENVTIQNIIPERAINDSFPTLPLPEHTDHHMEFHVRKHDIDINKHVTNRVIAEWALETLPFEITKTHELAELEITFKGQAFYGDIIDSKCQIILNEEQYTGIHHIINSSNGQSIARIRSQWKKGTAGIF